MIGQHAEMTEQNVTAMKRAELLSTLGAGVLGMGIALLFPNLLAGYAIPILLIGIVAHTVGMFQMRALEQQSSRPRARWMEILYWFCWIVLAALLVYMVVRVIGWA